VRTSTNYFGVIGDCNANSYGSRFFSELLEFCSENGLLVSDLQFLGPSSNTYTERKSYQGSTNLRQLPGSIPGSYQVAPW